MGQACVAVSDELEPVGKRPQLAISVHKALDGPGQHRSSVVLGILLPASFLDRRATKLRQEK